jgi:hypothetical protein
LKKNIVSYLLRNLKNICKPGEVKTKKISSESTILTGFPNSEVVYAAEKLDRDMAAIDEFLKTDIIEYIKNIR